MAITQTCSIPDCGDEAMFKTRTRPSWCSTHLNGLLGQKWLTPLEPFTHPTTPWLVHCELCGYDTHIRLDYILVNAKPCSVCRWRSWEAEIAYGIADPADRLRTLFANIPLSDTEWAVERARANDYEYIERVPNPAMPISDIHLVRCVHCGRRIAKRTGDIGWGCSCRVNPRSQSQREPGPAKPREKRLMRDVFPDDVARLWDTDANDPGLLVRLSPGARTEVSWKCADCGHRWQESPHKIARRSGAWMCPVCLERGTSKRKSAGEAERERYAVTPVSNVPELMQVWADSDLDPTMVVVNGDTKATFRCPNGHTRRTIPYLMLKSACPDCGGVEAQRRRLQATRRSPDTQLDRELVSQWHPFKNTIAIEKVGPDSERSIWWRDPNCGHEWQDKPRARGQRFRLRCPECKTILDSLAWSYPELAEEWSPDNPTSPWHVRPSGRLDFTPKWVCKVDPSHQWQASAFSRTQGGRCPECVGVGKSAVELSFHAAAEGAFGEARSGSIIYSESFMRRGRWTVDIAVDSPDPAYRGVVIEYDGSYWHKAKADVDADKSVDLLAAGYAVVRLREAPLEALPVGDPRYLEIPVHAGSNPDAVIAQVKAWVADLP